MRKFFKDFKAFISKGNILDMAVGVIIGSAFSAIINSLVNDILMPVIALMVNVQSLKELSITLHAESAPGAGDALTWNYGNFIAAIINFLLIALVLFCIIKAVMAANGFTHPKHGECITKQEYKKFRKEGKSKEEIKAINAQRVEEKKKADEEAKRVAFENSTEGLLKKAVELLERIEEKDNKDKENKKASK
ncbi:MAG TPA: large conductance mechanosensitive channel protein MscL [Firmicutes bacterium]|nr:large conductance mechanosensitive channel protein MscL [Bacillota bacterium]